MKKIIIENIEINIPEPMYILPETLKVSERGRRIEGNCIFPSSDISVADRRDHANFTHMIHVMWNCAAIVRTQQNWQRSLASHVEASANQIIPPDTTCKFLFSAEITSKHEHKVLGSAKTEFSIASVVHAVVTADFVAYK